MQSREKHPLNGHLQIISHSPIKASHKHRGISNTWKQRLIETSCHMKTGKWIKVPYKEPVKCIPFLHKIKRKKVLFQPLFCCHNHFTRYKHESTKGRQWCTPKIMWLAPQTTNEIANINATYGFKYINIQYSRRNTPPWYNMLLIKKRSANHKA